MLRGDGSNLKEAEKASVEGQLKQELNKEKDDYKVVSHAYDGFTTSSVLRGDHVGRVLGISYRKQGYPNLKHQAYLENRQMKDEKGLYFVNPLHNFKKFVEDNPMHQHYVVISVGGNDFREKLSSLFKLLKEIGQVHTRYLKIVEEIKSLKDKNVHPILMFQYQLDARKGNDAYLIYTLFKIIGSFFAAVNGLCIVGITGFAISLIKNSTPKPLHIFGLFLSLALLTLSHRIIPLKITKGILTGQKIGLTTLGGLLERFYQPILAQAKKDRIPILDLPNTFNPYENLYISQIEPSEEGSKIIAKGISHIIKYHNFDSLSMLYSKKSSDSKFIAIENENSTKWQVTYPQPNN